MKSPATRPGSPLSFSIWAIPRFPPTPVPAVHSNPSCSNQFHPIERLPGDAVYSTLAGKHSGNSGANLIEEATHKVESARYRLKGTFSRFVKCVFLSLELGALRRRQRELRGDIVAQAARLARSCRPSESPST